MTAPRKVEKKGLASLCSCFTNFFKKKESVPAYEALLNEYSALGEIEMKPLSPSIEKTVTAQPPI